MWVSPIILIDKLQDQRVKVGKNSLVGKVRATKPEDLSLIPGTHMMEEEHQLGQVTV